MENEKNNHETEVHEEVAKTEDSSEEIVHHEVVSEEVSHHTHKKAAFLKKWQKVLTVKRLIIIALVILLLGLAYYFKGLVVAATVNGSVISRVEIIKSLEKASGKAALEAIIDERLINMEADNRKVTVSSEEIKTELDKIEKQLKDQGTSLVAALAENGLTIDELSKRITTQKKLEKMLADKVGVTDAEVDKYIKDNAITLPKDTEAEAKASIKEQITNTKLGEESTKLVDELNVKAKINKFVNY